MKKPLNRRSQHKGKTNGKMLRQLTLVTRGMVDRVRVGRGVVLRVYCTYDEAVAAGVAPDLASAAFEKGDPSGSCDRGERRNSTTHQLEAVYCSSNA
jgi:hypothetical protein